MARRATPALAGAGSPGWKPAIALGVLVLLSLVRLEEAVALSFFRTGKTGISTTRPVEAANLFLDDGATAGQKRRKKLSLLAVARAGKHTENKKYNMKSAQPQANSAVLAIQPQADLRPAAEAAEFRLLDRNRDGYIEEDDLAGFFAESQGLPAAAGARREFVHNLFSHLDLDANGVISWAEYSTPLDAEYFDFLLRTRNGAGARELTYVEDIYEKQFGNPYKAQRDLPPSEYNYRGEEIEKPVADEKYLPGYGWFKPSAENEKTYAGMLISPPKGEAAAANAQETGKIYSYSYEGSF
eukprot:gene399-11_t